MHVHNRNPRYLSIPTLTVSLLCAYLAPWAADAMHWGLVPAGTAYLCALLIPIGVKRLILDDQDDWSQARHDRHVVTRLPRHARF